MGYSCSCVDRDFFLKKENIDAALKELAASDYSKWLDKYPADAIQNILSSDNADKKLDLLNI